MDETVRMSDEAKTSMANENESEAVMVTEPAPNGEASPAPVANATPTAGEASAGETGVGDASLQELKAKADKAAEYYDRLLRLMADFDNFKKRAARERQESVKYAQESLLQKLLPTLDNFDMALSATQQPGAEGLEAIRTGLAMVHNQLKATLVEAGLEEIDATGKMFDPMVHEAVSQQPSPEVPEGHVCQQLRKGYRLRERLLRPAMVVVAKRPET